MQRAVDQRGCACECCLPVDADIEVSLVNRSPAQSDVAANAGPKFPAVCKFLSSPESPTVCSRHQRDPTKKPGTVRSQSKRADRAKEVMQIEMARSAPYFGDRIYLAAARSCADLACGRTIEDTATGVRAGLDASATVWGHCPVGHG